MLDAETVYLARVVIQNSSCAPIAELRHARVIASQGHAFSNPHRNTTTAVKVSATTEAYERHYWRIGAGMPSPGPSMVKYHHHCH